MSVMRGDQTPEAIEARIPCSCTDRSDEKRGNYDPVNKRGLIGPWHDAACPQHGPGRAHAIVTNITAIYT